MKTRLLCGILLVMCSVALTSCSNTASTTTSAATVPQYSELGSHMLNDCLVVEVATTSQDAPSREAITDDVLSNHSWDKMIRVFFYTPGQVPGTDIPSHRVERNAFDGQNKSY